MTVACSTSAFKSGLPEALAGVAGFGFGAVDLIAIPQWGHVVAGEVAADFDGQANLIEGLLAQHGLRPVAMNMAVGHLHQRDEATLHQRLADARILTRLMARLGIPVGSFYPGYLVADRPWDDVLADTVASYAELHAIACEAGVRLVVELHKNTPFETVEQSQRLLDAAPELGIAFDPSHFAMQGYTLAEVEPLLPRTVHLHLRGAAQDRMQAPVAETEFDLAGLCTRLRELGYTGDVSLEYLPGFEGDLGHELRTLKALAESILGG